MPSGPFAHVCFLVKDLDKAAEDWTKILQVLDPAQVTEPVVKYTDFSSGADQDMRWVTFVSHHGCEIQLIQPSPGGKTFEDKNMPWQRWGWVSHKSTHGVLLEVASPYESHRDGRWHPVAAMAAEGKS
jgi:methylmalonyl-CoA/ethylmalonyl-CoA epimerase